MAMVRLKNVSGRKIEQMFEGQMYVWEEDGDTMNLPAQLAGWMLGKLNGPDSNPELKASKKGVWLESVPLPEGAQFAEQGIVRAEKAKKAPKPVADEPKQPAGVPAAAPAK